MRRVKRPTEEDEYKPSSSGKKQKTTKFRLAQQTVTLRDLIKCNLLSVGQRIYVKEQEAEITEEGTIRTFSGGNQFQEFLNPTAFTRYCTGRESGGWQQIKLKPSGELLSTVKDKYLQNLAESGYDGSSVPFSVPEEPPVEDVNLPLNVRFACDESRPFKITWVSPDYQEFHFEYQNQTYSSLADFGQKIYDDMQNSNPPTNANFSFNSLVYEVEGKWVGAEKIIAETSSYDIDDEMENDNDNNINNVPNNNDTTTSSNNNAPADSNTIVGNNTVSGGNTVPSGNNAVPSGNTTVLSGNTTVPSDNAAVSNNNNNAPNDSSDTQSSPSKTKGKGKGKGRGKGKGKGKGTGKGNSNNSNSASNTPVQSESPQSHSTAPPNVSTTSTPTSSPGKGLPEPVQFKILLTVDNDVPARVNASASTMQELLSALADESGLNLSDLSRYDITLWDEEFSLFTKFPKKIFDIPVKCKVNIKKLVNSPIREHAAVSINGSGDIHMQDLDSSTSSLVNNDVTLKNTNSDTNAGASRKSAGLDIGGEQQGVDSVGI